MPRTLHKQAKVCLVGDSEVGKSSLAQRFVRENFAEQYVATRGTRVYAVELTLPRAEGLDIALDLSIQDLVGQKGFMRMVRETFFYRADGIVAICDVTKPETLPSLHDWVMASQEIASDAVLHLAANKADLHWRVDEASLTRLAEAYAAPVFATSAKTGDGVDELFQSLAAAIVTTLEVEEAQASSEADVYVQILEFAGKRYPEAVSKDEFFRAIRGIGYDALEENLNLLANDGYVEVNVMGPGKFSVTATLAGLKAVAFKPSLQAGRTLESE